MPWVWTQRCRDAWSGTAVRLFSRSLLGLVLVSVSTPGVRAQTAAPPSDGPVASLSARARLVVVDVTVTGRDPPTGAAPHPGQFQLLEDGAPQTLKSFEEHVPAAPGTLARYAAIPKLPPGTFTNFVPTPVGGAVNILLLDALNTPVKDQFFVRDQLLDYLNHARPGTSIAIFGLTTQLVMLQGFTSDPELLETVVTRQRGHGSPYLNAGDSLRPSATMTDQMEEMGSPLPAQVVSRIQTFEDMQTSKISQSRAKLTLDALSAMARYLANLPGRENLIWFPAPFLSISDRTLPTAPTIPSPRWRTPSRSTTIR